MESTFEPFRTVLYDKQHLVTKSIAEADAMLAEIELYRAAAEHSLQQLYLAEDEAGWSKIGVGAQTDDFDRRMLEEIIAFAKAMYIHNPMINRAVTVKQLYIWALGYSITSQTPELKQFAIDFFNSRTNKAEFNHDALKSKEGALQYTGNLFFIFFTDNVSGDVRVRSVDVSAIEAIYTNPDDPKEPWFYLRKIKSTSRDQTQTKEKMVWHPDWQFDPINRSAVEPPKDLYRYDTPPVVDWDHPVYHIKTGGTENMRFGFPEIFSALNWAKALRRFYENWSTMMESYAKVAMQMVRQDKSSLAASKSKVQTAVGGDKTTRLIGDSAANPTGQWLLQSGGVRLEAVKTAGATTGTEEGRGLAKMVAAGVGLPLTFLGDLDHGNEATATTLDRPTELNMVDRQTSWNERLVSILNYAMIKSAQAPKGVLKQLGYTVETIINRIDNVREYKLIPPDGTSVDISIEFPDILERNATERVRALIMGVTLMGKPISNVIPDQRYVRRKLLEAFGESSDVVEQLMAQWEKDGLFEKNDDMDALNPEPEPVLGPANGVPGAPGTPPPTGEGE